MADKQKELCDELISLVHLDIDAIHAYTTAIDKIDIEEVKSKLMEFRSDHDRHVSDLSPFIVRMGGQAPERKPDFKGFFIQGMTQLRSVTGNEGALKAMKSNEELTNSKYEKALSYEMPEDIRSVVVRNREDERRHLDYIVDALETHFGKEKKVA